jgi:NAD(P)-dependent dehydrogenase (short-subunit alcohol dehydrogenase family)
MNVIITGANRGIGLELARQCAVRGDRVFAAARDPSKAKALNGLAKESAGKLSVHACDVSDDASVAAFAKAVNEPIDVLINNAGINPDDGTLTSFRSDEAIETYSVNAVGPLRMARAFLPALRRGQRAKIISISSGMGSIEQASGGSYPYRMSKAALNMAMRSLAQDLRSEGVIAVAMSPGWVRTDMGGASAPTSVEDSAAGLIKVIGDLTPADSGSFRDYRGHSVPW